MEEGASMYINAYQVLHICTEADCVLDVGRQIDHVGEGQTH